MVYMITFTINTPPMLAYIYHTWILWVNILMNKTAKIKNCNLHIGQFEASARPPHWIPWRQGTRSIFQKMCSPRRHFLHNLKRSMAEAIAKISTCSKVGQLYKIVISWKLMCCSCCLLQLCWHLIKFLATSLESCEGIIPEPDGVFGRVWQIAQVLSYFSWSAFRLRICVIRKKKQHNIS
jgi:hypothetical protein